MSDLENGVDADGDRPSDEQRSSEELPDDVIDEAERLTRLARTATDENERAARLERRDDLLDEHEFTARVRDDEDATLVLHPAEWHEDGVIRTDRIEDIDRAIEIRLEGTENPDDWRAVDERNRELAAAVRERRGDVHGDNADALAAFFGNHYAKPIASATPAELEEFRTEYFVRNAWPSEDQREAIEESIRLVFEAIDEPHPELRESSAE
ncbi:DUF7108 family protein [Natronococcus jeotgali]|uniref:RnhA operon protein n=1 Tax=Natronococcus jeotgali DSM 18795 TaxID=1227498 RepID=L9X676_9EURY|nr:hypothetical protein [Natronococcus jeotgali]ELY56951.1 hypothetical protein C492_14100 [Natronococcus jeotgali DSM 18795]